MDTVQSKPSGPTPLDSAAVRAELRRILSSTQFSNSPRLSRFLEYVVECTLAGQASELKEYRVAVDVFERSASYDPQNDAVVRVEAGRLRTKLAGFYSNEGRDSEVRIGVPKGGFAAVFEPASNAIAEAPPDNNFIEPLPASASTSRSRRILWRLVIAATLCVLALGVIIARYRALASKKLPFEVITAEKITHSGDVRLVAISPDGKYILDALTDEGLESLWLRNVVTGADVQIVPREPVHYRGLQFSRDGSVLYFVRSEQQDPSLNYLYRVPILGGQPQKLITDVDSSVSFSPDGAHFVFITYGSDQYRLVIASQDGTSQRDLIRGPMTAPIFEPAWSPDGKTVAATTREVGNALSTLVTIDVATGKSGVLLKSATSGTRLSLPVWLPDGSGLLVLIGTQNSNFTEQQISLVSYPEGKVHPVTRETNNYSDISLAADGRTLATVQSDARWDLFVMHSENPGDTDGQQLTSDAPIQSFSWTPDDKLIISQDSGLSLLDPANGSRSKLSVPTSSVPSQPSVCRDGHVVFALPNAGADKGQGIWRMSADGQNLTQLTQGPRDRFPMCASNSRSVYYEDFAETGHLWKVSLAGGHPQPVTEIAVSTCIDCDYRIFDLSSDGSWTVFPTFVGADAPIKLTLLSLTAASPPRELEWKKPSLRLPVLRFAGSNNWLAYPVRTRGVDNIWLQEIDGPGLRQLTNFTSGRIRDFEFSPRGGKLAFIHANVSSDVVLIHDSTP
jgi:Tol biopolymer transport system component